MQTPRIPDVTTNVNGPQTARPLRRRPPRAALPPLTLSSDYRYSIPHLEQRIRQKVQGTPLRILEAGCGAKWPLRLEGTPYKLTAVDIDTHALEVRKTRVRDVDEVMVGDLRTSNLFPSCSFDVIYNSFVLEHIEGAERVLDNFLAWLAPGGLLILRIPDRDSVYGLLTRCTPFWAHVLYKKYVEGVKDAGQPGHGPYPTSHDEVVSRRGIHRYCSDHGCVVQYEAGFSGYLPKAPLVRALARVTVQSIATLSFGRFDWRYNNLTFVIEK